MPKIITTTSTTILPGKGILLAEAGKVPVIEMRDTAADRVSLRIYSADMKEIKGDPIDSGSAPFAFDLNHLPPGEYAIEFRPFVGKKYLGADRRTFRLELSRPHVDPVPSNQGQGANDKPVTPAKTNPEPPTPPPDITVSATYPKKLESGKTYDGGGAVIDAAGLRTVFALSGHRDVTIRNWRVPTATGPQWAAR